MELRKIVGKLEYDKETKQFIEDEGYKNMHKILGGLAMLSHNNLTIVS